MFKYRGVTEVLNAYCIFCKTGSENYVKQQINKIDDNIIAIVPVRVLWEKHNGKWETRERPMLPGYVFLYYEDKLPDDILRTLVRHYKLLEYDTGKRELWGYDYEYAMWIYSHNGRIEESKALFEGDIIKVVDGPLAEGIGRIIKLDRHKRRAWVEFDFAGRIFRVSLSVVDITHY